MTAADQHVSSARSSGSARAATPSGADRSIVTSVTLGWAAAVAGLICGAANDVAADWPQLQGGPLRSGDHPSVTLPEDLGLVAAVPLSDAVFAAPVVVG